MFLGELFFCQKWRLQAMHHDAVSVSAWCGARVLQVITTARMQHLCMGERAPFCIISSSLSARCIVSKRGDNGGKTKAREKGYPSLTRGADNHRLGKY
jgi:hypothetical protein